MQDDVKKALEELEQTFAIVHRVATHQSDAAYMSIPADPKRDADLRHMVAVEMLRTHISAEPARLAAALDVQLARLTREFSAEVAAAREEQREACAQFCEEEYYDVSHSECAFADSLEAIRATPLIATPLADRIAELEGIDECSPAASCSEKPEIDWCRSCLLAALRRAEARAKELEADVEVGKETCRRHGTTRATAADGWPASKLIGFLSHSLAGKDAAIKDAAESASQLRSERDALKTQLAEAAEVVASLCDQIRQGRGFDTLEARAFLAKYPEGR